MTDEELIARLRDKNCCESPSCNCDAAADRIEALVKREAKLSVLLSAAGSVADIQKQRAEAAEARIEALVKERDEALEWLSARQGYIADAFFALDKQEKAEAKRDVMETIATQWKARAERLEAALRLLHDNVVLAFPTLADLGPVANARAALKGADHE